MMKNEITRKGGADQGGGHPGRVKMRGAAVKRKDRLGGECISIVTQIQKVGCHLIALSGSGGRGSR